MSGGGRSVWPKGAVWRNRSFVSVWAAASVSVLGSQVSLLALPFVAVTTLHGSAFEVAAIGFAALSPMLIFGLPAGVWLDRIRRWPVMLGTDLGRALVFASIPVAYAAGVLTIWQLYAVAFISGALSVFFDVASVSFLPTIVPREDLPDANAGMQVSVRAAQVFGPGVAGVLVALLGAPYAVAADAASYLGSAGFLSRLKVKESVAPRTERRAMRTEIREGWRYVIHHPIQRPLIGYLVGANFFNVMLYALFIVFAVRRLGLSSREVGVVFMVANVAALLGATATPKLQRRFGLGRVMLVAVAGGSGLLLIPFAPSGAVSIPFLAGGLLISGVATTIWMASSGALAQATTPPQLMSRIAATRRIISGIALPAGPLVGGLLAAYIGLHTAVSIAAIGRAVIGLTVLASPLHSIRTIEDADAIVRPYNEALTASG